MLALRWLEVGSFPIRRAVCRLRWCNKRWLWINHMVGQLQHIGFEAHVAASPARHWATDRCFRMPVRTMTSGDWAIQSEQVEWLGMKDRLTRIRRSVPVLGETALYWLQRASGRTLYALTPQSARDLCEYIHWQGSDQTEWLDEMRSMGMTEEDLGMQFLRIGMTVISRTGASRQAGAG